MYRGYFTIPGHLVLLEKLTVQGWKSIPLDFFAKGELPALWKREWPVKDSINFFVCWYGQPN